jgi:hypothetical protein
MLHAQAAPFPRASAARNRNVRSEPSPAPSGMRCSRTARIRYCAPQGLSGSGSQRQRAYAFAALTSAMTVQLIEWARPELALLEPRPQEIGMATLGAEPRAFGDAVFAHSADPLLRPSGSKRLGGGCPQLAAGSGLLQGRQEEP